MNICVFDTETTSLDKPFCYNIGYVIKSLDSGETLLKKDFVVEQVWHNPMLFSTAYYADKRPIYVNAMRARKTVMDKFGYICQEMLRDFKQYEIGFAYAYNASFDEKVFNFNCDWFKCNNPFDNVEIIDIRPFAIRNFVDDDYKAFCEENNCFTDSKNYSTTAETMYQYLTKNAEFIEDHTALSDSEIESDLLLDCYENGLFIFAPMECPRSIKREHEDKWKVVKNGGVVFETTASSVTVSKTKNTITLK